LGDPISSLLLAVVDAISWGSSVYQV